MLDATPTASPPWDATIVRRFLLPLFFVTLSFPVALQQTSLGLVLLLLIVQCWQRRTAPTTPLDRALLLLFGAFLLSTLLSPDIGNSLLSYRKLWLVGAFFASFMLVTDRREAERLIQFFVVFAVLIASYGIVQHFTGLDLAKQLVGKPASLDPFWFGRQEGFRTKGFHPSGITYAHNLLFPLSIITAWVFAPAVSWHQRLLLVGGWAVMILALLFSLTRGVWVAYVGILFLLGVIRGGKTLVGVAGGIVLLGGLLFSAGSGVQERAWKTFDLKENLGRSQIWLANWDMLKDRPLFGWGYGNYREFREPYYQRYPMADHTGHAHNSFLQIAVDSGLIGLAAFLAFFVVLLRTGWQAYCLLPPTAEPLRSFALGAWLSIVGFLIGGMTQHNFGDAEVVIVMWTVAGLLAKMSVWAVEGKGA
ncbi:MAG: O-antigen ligase family protein [Deltaproteobacteria bacterium]|nr:O-antigen ligase family protein [Deltaproteobacteria bacterium]